MQLHVLGNGDTETGGFDIGFVPVTLAGSISGLRAAFGSAPGGTDRRGLS
ncbi:hypothetical protein [Microbulbifer sp. S227A]